MIFLYIYIFYFLFLFKFSLWGSTVASGDDKGYFFGICIIGKFYLLTKQQPFHFLVSGSCVNMLLKIPVRTKLLKKSSNFLSFFP